MKTSRSRASVFPGIDRRVNISGLKDATVTFLTYPNTNFTLALNDITEYAKTNVDYSTIDNGNKVICGNITGVLSISYGEEPKQHLK